MFLQVVHFCSHTRTAHQAIRNHRSEAGSRQRRNNQMQTVLANHAIKESLVNFLDLDQITLRDLRVSTEVVAMTMVVLPSQALPHPKLVLRAYMREVQTNLKHAETTTQAMHSVPSFTTGSYACGAT